MKAKWIGIILLTLIAGDLAAKDLQPALKLYEERVLPNESAEFELLARRIQVVQESLRSRATGPTRGTHVKSRGCLRGSFRVLPERPAWSMQGVFQRERTFENVFVRYSNAWPFARSDRLPDLHGMAVSITGVEGPRLLDDESDRQDFLANDIPNATVPDAKSLVELTEASSKGNAGVLQFLATRLDVAEIFAREAKRREFRPKSAPLYALEYFSGTPFRWGKIAAKFIWKPCGANENFEKKNRPTGKDFLAEELREFSLRKSICYDFYVQPQRDPILHPIEDSGVNWEESTAPAYRIGQLTLPPQDIQAEEMRKQCESASFDPWRGLQDHRPLGNTNRSRLYIYSASRSKRYSAGVRQF